MFSLQESWHGKLCHPTICHARFFEYHRMTARIHGEITFFIQGPAMSPVES